MWSKHQGYLKFMAVHLKGKFSSRFLGISVPFVAEGENSLTTSRDVTDYELGGAINPNNFLHLNKTIQKVEINGE